MQYTDTQLKQALAKMLPDVIEYYQRQCDDKCWWWKYSYCKDYARPVLDTELLHLCWLVEEGVEYKPDYLFYLREQFGFPDAQSEWDDHWWRHLISATWQQRVIALAKVKGVAIL